MGRRSRRGRITSSHSLLQRARPSRNPPSRDPTRARIAQVIHPFSRSSRQQSNEWSCASRAELIWISGGTCVGVRKLLKDWKLLLLARSSICSVGLIALVQRPLLTRCSPRLKSESAVRSLVVRVSCRVSQRRHDGEQLQRMGQMRCDPCSASWSSSSGQSRISCGDSQLRAFVRIQHVRDRLWIRS